MSFRTIEITGPAELHVSSGSLYVEKEKKESLPADGKKSVKKRKPETQKWIIPLGDISSIICMGAGIRISTMAMAQICRNKITMMILDEKYQPAGILNSCEANSRQSMIMRHQVYADSRCTEKVWCDIIRQKINNQATALDILGLKGKEHVSAFAEKLDTACQLPRT